MVVMLHLGISKLFEGSDGTRTHTHQLDASSSVHLRLTPLNHLSYCFSAQNNRLTTARARNYSGWSLSNIITLLHLYFIRANQSFNLVNRNLSKYLRIMNDLAMDSIVNQKVAHPILEYVISASTIQYTNGLNIIVIMKPTKVLAKASMKESSLLCDILGLDCCQREPFTVMLTQSIGFIALLYIATFIPSIYF